MNSKVIDSIFESMLGRLIFVVFIHFQNNDINFTTTCMKIDAIYAIPARYIIRSKSRSNPKQNVLKNDNFEENIRRQCKEEIQPVGKSTV